MARTNQKTVERNFIEAQALVIVLVLLIVAIFTSVILFLNSRYELNQYVQHTSKILSISATPSVVFNDKREAQNVLTYLSADPDFVRGSIRRKGIVFASYEREDDVSQIYSPWQSLIFHTDLKDNEETFGTLTLEIDMNRVYTATLNNIIAIFSASLVALLIGVLIARKLEKRFTLPINEVLDLMKNVSETHNYKIHLPDDILHRSPLEIGFLYQQFREMIQEIKSRDEELLDSNQNLEVKVKERTEQLEQAQQKMLEDAHKAGIADVATGVLHNIGNILNTVTTSSSQLRIILGNNNLLPKFEKTVETFEQNKEDLSEFLNTNNRSELITDYMRKLHSAFTDEFTHMSSLNSSIRQSTSIIADIIHDQQALASRHFNREYIDIEETLNRALEIKDNYIQRCSVSVKKTFEKLPRAYGHRARVFQVFVNLISNCAEAFPEKQSNRQLMISRSDNGKDLTIEFHDNGPGVNENNQRTLFSYGFTTKESGHGFGLHSCRTYMRELDGDLVYRPSEILGGACFSVIIPLTPAAEEIRS